MEHYKRGSLPTGRRPKYRRAFSLPFGFKATFSFDGNAFHAEWHPDLPFDHIRKPKATRRMLAAYRRARDDFMLDVATMLRIRVTVIEWDEIDDGLAFTTTEPGTLQ
ncbi:hypothetical protein [Sinorhizobium chiapasense]|uniref:Uncharacterized protein n=1 Tax=Sinorhizobium chiapasense TaxID=501572 RepID=A0ABZ2B840_9HYPH